ncbi:MAG: hypothetical protein V3V95_08185, partial [Thermodesulfobacteriota bacterium]
MVLSCVFLATGCTSILIKDESFFQDPKMAIRTVQDSLRGRATIRLSNSKGKETSGKAVILVKGPDKVRIEIFGPF